MKDGTIGSDDIIVCEILSRLPVKSLVRFKCVCKHWLQLIQEDSYFIDLHLTHSKTRISLFYVIMDPRDRYKDKRFTGRDEFFLTADLSFDGIAEIQSLRRTNLFCYDQILGPVNGLICFVDKHKYAVCIYNISTREASPWIHSTLFPDQKKKHPERYTQGSHHPTYQFGFDPTTKEYKVLCMWSTSRRGSNFHEVCEILTLGEGTWRRIDEIPPCKLGERLPSVCVNGTIYWCTNILTHPQELHSYPLRIAAFDVGTEKFRMIQIPNFIPDQPLDPDENFHSYIRLTELYGGSVAVVLRLSAYKIKLWILDDHVHDNEKGNGTSAFGDLGDGVGTVKTIILPFPWDRNRDLSIYGVVGTFQIIILSYSAFKGYINCVSLHSYNQKEKTFTDIVTTGAHISIPGFSCIKVLTPFVESLLRVRSSEAIAKY
ncbi:hypothetical protein MKW92_047722 [Papaver armeniacum]|nr:hypothetical protein MKW92_047722 [Papaver armeniacum]